MNINRYRKVCRVGDFINIMLSVEIKRQTELIAPSILVTCHNNQVVGMSLMENGISTKRADLTIEEQRYVICYIKQNILESSGVV